MSLSELVRVLTRASYPEEVINEITAELDDPVDFDRDQHILERHGLTVERLMGRMGASP